MTFEAIAAEAGVSQSLPFKYFHSIDEVALELYERLVNDVDAESEAMLADDALDFDTKLRGTFGLWCSLVERDGFLMVRLAEGSDAPNFNRAVDRRRERTISAWAGEIGREFALDVIGARLASASVQAAGSALVRRVFVDGLDRSDVAEALVALARGQCESLAGADITVGSWRGGRGPRRRGDVASPMVTGLSAPEIV